MDKAATKNLVAAIVMDLVHTGLALNYPEAIRVATASMERYWKAAHACPKCQDTGHVPLPPDPARPTMARRGPCFCPAGRQWAEGIAQFVNEHPPDKIISPKEGTSL